VEEEEPWDDGKSSQYQKLRLEKRAWSRPREQSASRAQSSREDLLRARDSSILHDHDNTNQISSSYKINNMVKNVNLGFP